MSIYALLKMGTILTRQILLTETDTPASSIAVAWNKHSNANSNTIFFIFFYYKHLLLDVYIIQIN